MVIKEIKYGKELNARQQIPRLSLNVHIHINLLISFYDAPRMLESRHNFRLRCQFVSSDDNFGRMNNN